MILKKKELKSHNYLCKSRKPKNITNIYLRSEFIYLHHAYEYHQRTFKPSCPPQCHDDTRQKGAGYSKAVTITAADICYMLTMVRHCPCVISFIPRNGPMRLVLFLFCFCITGNWDTQKLSSCSRSCI